MPSQNAAGLAEVLEGLGAAFPCSSWGSLLARPHAPRPGLCDQRGQARGWRGDRAPVEGQGGVFLVPHCRDAGRTQGLRTGRGVWSDPTGSFQHSTANLKPLITCLQESRDALRGRGQMLISARPGSEGSFPSPALRPRSGRRGTTGPDGPPANALTARSPGADWDGGGSLGRGNAVGGGGGRLRAYGFPSSFQQKDPGYLRR